MAENLGPRGPGGTRRQSLMLAVKQKVPHHSSLQKIAENCKSLQKLAEA